MAKANQIIHLERDTVLIPRRPAQLWLMSRSGKASLYTRFKPNVAKHPAAFHTGPCVITAGTLMWDYYKGGGLAKRRLLRLGERNIWVQFWLCHWLCGPRQVLAPLWACLLRDQQCSNLVAELLNSEEEPNGHIGLRVGRVPFLPHSGGLVKCEYHLFSSFS